MFKKILKKIQQFSGSHSKSRGHRNYSSSGRSKYGSYSHSSGKRNYNKYGGSHNYKRRNRSSS